MKGRVQSILAQRNVSKTHQKVFAFGKLNYFVILSWQQKPKTSADNRRLVSNCCCTFFQRFLFAEVRLKNIALD
jgi:hypothetical protein